MPRRAADFAITKIQKVFCLPLTPQRAFTFASRGKSKQKRYRMRKPLKTHATAALCCSSSASAVAAELADGSNMRRHPSQRNGSTSRFFAIPLVHNIHLCGFCVRPGRGDFKRTPININKIKIKIWVNWKLHLFLWGNEDKMIL
jgi:hypothetical protein